MDAVPTSRWRRPSIGGRRQTVSASQLPNWYAVHQAHLSTSRVSILNQILSTAQDDLDIRSTSRLLVTNTDAASTLLQWYRNSAEHTANAPDIVIAREFTETTELPGDLEGMGNAIFRLLDEVVAREGRFTHAFVFVDSERADKDVVSTLRTVARAIPSDGGVMLLWRNRTDAVAEVLQAAGIKYDVHLPGSRSRRSDSVVSNDDSLVTLAEQAGFKRENVVQSFSKQHLVDGSEVEKLAGQMETALEGSLQFCEDGEGWKAELKGAVERGLRRDGGLLVNADVVVLKK